MSGIDLPCDWRAGFVMDPSKKQRVGYITGFKGLNLGDFFKSDVEVFTPYTSSAAPTGGITLQGDAKDKAVVVGVLDNFSFGGGVGDPICLSGYISSDNANQIQTKLKTTVDTTKVTELSWWITSFDEENKAWFEEAYPKDPVKVTGQINAPGGKDLRITVSQTGTKVHPNIDVVVYNFYVEVIPAADRTFALHFASSAGTNYVKNWGLKVGEKAAAAMG